MTQRHIFRKETGGLWVEGANFTAVQRATLKKICSAPEFAEGVSNIAGEYGQFSKLAREQIKPGAIRPTLEEFRKRVRSLLEAVEGLGPIASMLVGQLHRFGGAPAIYDLDKLKVLLEEIETVASMALAEHGKQPTRRKSTFYEGQAAFALCQLFEWFNLSFTASDSKNSQRAAVRCLQIVFQAGTGKVISEATAQTYVKRGKRAWQEMKQPPKPESGPVVEVLPRPSRGEAVP